ncbi:hypothetical protein HLH17_14480 [Acinetobacter sp. ANC 5380]|uniref:Thiol:disulfide interchange protein DsbD N-terminal domain-containing protein n=1 Tax=Acinetobacter terrae TaxID=2731247 RepID=A0A7Y2WCI1_9GAMM|nr:protein-disulfide reductase DsbD N-terminal domain-containing protein [Acinetobacter terrae]NNH78828.1 hypothetical protein [Acinetobacter terrae]
MNLKKSFFALCLVAVHGVGYAQDYLPPSMAFKTVLSGNTITIHIADGYYLYQNKISLIDQHKPVRFNFLNKPLVKSFPQQGKTKVFQKSVKLHINSQQQYKSLAIKYQGCSYQGLCYPPQQIALK